MLLDNAQKAPGAVLKGSVLLAPRCPHPPGFRADEGGAQSHSCDERRGSASPAGLLRSAHPVVSHPPGTVGRFADNLGHLSLHRGRCWPRFVFHSRLPEHLLGAGLWKLLGKCSHHPCPRAAHCPAGTQTMRGQGVTEALAGLGMGGIQDGFP